MKKFLCLVALMMAAVCLMTACSFYTNMSDNTGTAKMQALTKVEEMMAALADSDMDGALALMHPDVAPNSESALAQLRDYLAGRNAVNLEQKSLSVNTSTGTQGTVRQENAAFQVSLEDGTDIYLAVYYVTGDDAEGFVSFQIVLGMI